MVRHRLVAGAVLCLVAGCGTSTTTPPADTQAPASDSAPAPTTEPAAVNMPDPQNITIPALDVTSTLVPLGVTEDNQHEVPPLDQPEQAGWFIDGPEPGEPGASIILGHINGRGVPGVFAELDQLTVGDVIEVDDLRFVVYDVIHAPKDQFPAELIYRNKGTPELRAITCGGIFLEDSGNYADNIIAFARLAGE